MSAPVRLPAQVRFVDSVRPRFGPDRGFLFDERSGRVFSLNGSGAFAAARLHEHAVRRRSGWLETISHLAAAPAATCVLTHATL